MVRKHYTVADAARMVGVGPWTLRRLEQEGRLPAARRDGLSRYRVYSADDIEAIRQALQSILKDAVPA